MKKSKKSIVGFVLCAIGVIGLFGLFAETEDRISLLFGSITFIIVGVILLLVAKKSNASKKPTDSPAQTEAAKPNTAEKKDDIYAQAEAARKNHDYFTFRVAGVTFYNGRRSRQVILRKINFHDDPFEWVNWTLRQYDYNGETAVGVYANDQQVGNVPRKELAFVLDNWDRIRSVYHASITGGGTDHDGQKLNFGCEITLCLEKAQ